MLTELCQEIHNWFSKDEEKRFGVFTIKDGRIDGDFGIQDSQYFRIVGSVFNDGVYQFPAENLKDETFDGAIWLMNVPPPIISLSERIDEWKEKYQDVVNSPFQSESFKGYSYSKASGGGRAGGSTGLTWESVFADELNKWRKA